MFPQRLKPHLFAIVYVDLKVVPFKNIGFFRSLFKPGPIRERVFPSPVKPVPRGLQKGEGYCDTSTTLRSGRDDKGEDGEYLDHD